MSRKLWRIGTPRMLEECCHHLHPFSQTTSEGTALVPGSGLEAGRGPSQEAGRVYAGAHQGRLVLTRGLRFVFSAGWLIFFKSQSCLFGFFFGFEKKKNEVEAQKAKRRLKQLSNRAQRRGSHLSPLLEGVPAPQSRQTWGPLV